MFSKEAQFSKPLTIPPAWYTFLLPAKVYAVLHGHVLTSSRGQWLRNALPRISPRSAFPSAIESPQKPWLQQELKILYEVLSTVWYANPEWKDSAKNQNKLQRRKKNVVLGTYVRSTPEVQGQFTATCNIQQFICFVLMAICPQYKFWKLLKKN